MRHSVARTGANGNTRRSYPTVKESDLQAVMRDGTVLRADVYRPDKRGRFPVLLCRTPYDKGGEKQLEIGPEMAERGYVVVMQDVRGRYASDGEFQPGFFSADHRDSEDGYETVAWAAGLPWSKPVATITARRRCRPRISGSSTTRTGRPV